MRKRKISAFGKGGRFSSSILRLLIPSSVVSWASQTRSKWRKIFQIMGRIGAFLSFMTALLSFVAALLKIFQTFQ